MLEPPPQKKKKIKHGYDVTPQKSFFSPNWGRLAFHENPIRTEFSKLYL